MHSMTHVETLIIGGGLSGLALAEQLEAQGRDYLLVEARDRFGGRIETRHHGAGYFDMGPAWFWNAQPRIAALIARLGLEVFPQYAEGALTFEDAHGAVQHGRGFSSMQGSWRVKGGLGAVTRALADKLGKGRAHLNTPVTALKRGDTGITVTFDTTALKIGAEVRAKQVVLALPPRVAAQLDYLPPLPADALAAMNGIATWMAGQAKAVAVYETPFWRDAGLSGDAQSRAGPMGEIHDASPAMGGPYALFGFIGVSPQGRVDEPVLRRHLTAQLVRLFGPDAAEPSALFIKDWARDNHTSTSADLAPLYTHPRYGMPPQIADLWNDTLHFSGTETASEFGGYIEGALEAAEVTLAHIT